MLQAVDLGHALMPPAYRFPSLSLLPCVCLLGRHHRTYAATLAPCHPLPAPQAIPPSTHPTFAPVSQKPGSYSGYRFWCTHDEYMMPEVAAHCRAHGDWRARQPILLNNGTMYNSPRTPEGFHAIIAEKAQLDICEHAGLSVMTGFPGWLQLYELPAGQAAPWPAAYDLDQTFCFFRNFMRGIGHLHFLYGERLHFIVQEEMEADTLGVLARAQSILGLPPYDFSSMAGLSINSGDAPGINATSHSRPAHDASEVLPETWVLVRPELSRVCEELQQRFAVAGVCKRWGMV